MEINITHFVHNEDPCQYSASTAELGSAAGQITWNNAKEAAGDSLLIQTPDELEVFRSWIAEFGAWDRKEIAAWDAVECNALLIQFISGDLRELFDLCPSDNNADQIDWDEAEKLSQKGTIGGRISPGDDGKVYFYMGS